MRDDRVHDPAVHAVHLRMSGPPWALRWWPECSCGWRGISVAYRADAEHAAVLHQTDPTGEAHW